jgi:hypothetical protein
VIVTDGAHLQLREECTESVLCRTCYWEAVAGWLADRFLGSSLAK